MPTDYLPGSSTVYYEITELDASSLTVTSVVSSDMDSSFYLDALSREVSNLPTEVFSIDFLLDTLPSASISARPVLPR